MYRFILSILLILSYVHSSASLRIDSVSIPLSDFTSIIPANQSDSLFIPSHFSFQVLAQNGQPLNASTSFPPNFDFTGYVPIAGSSEHGYLSISSEFDPGGVSIVDLGFNTSNKRWQISNGRAVDFSSVLGTIANCSGTVTPWNTIITCEEYVISTDENRDGYLDTGWAIEIDPVSGTVINNQKLWALGNFKHENLVVHSNQRTAYQGADSSPGYLFKYVSDVAQILDSGKLYVYKGSKNGSGNWLLLSNSTPTERNSVMSQSAQLGATSFAGIEDVEISPIDGKVYFAVKGESAVYRFQDSDPLTGTTVTSFETFAGGNGQSYDLATESGIVNEPWGNGNDNLAFDNEGNLWVLQDGSKNHLWVVGKNHTNSSPDVRIFMRTPSGSEPTGITFSPDNRFLFMSIQHPSGGNSSSTQYDVTGAAVTFATDVAIVIARNEHWGLVPCQSSITQTVGSIESGYYQSSSGTIVQIPIEAPKKLVHRAANSIQLNSGFSTQEGSTFKAEIGNCY